MRYLKTTAKVLAWIVGILLLLLLIIALAIQVPAVQNRLLGYAIPTIEQTLGGAHVEIARIDLDFFDAWNVEGIYVEDLRGDTLLYARELAVDIGVLNLFGSEIFLDEIALDGAVINAYQRSDDSAFNYQFILDAFAPADTAVVDTSAAAFTFGLRTVDLRDTRVRLLDERAPSDLNVSLRQARVDIDELDLENLAIDIEDVFIDGLRGSFEIQQYDPIQRKALATVTDTSAAGAATAITFPYAGLPVSVQELEIKDVNLAYRDLNTDAVPGGIDPGNIAVTDFNALAQNFTWDSTRLALEWEELSFRERSGLEVDELAFELALTEDALRLENFKVVSPASVIAASVTLDYPSFAQLAALDPATAVDLTFDQTAIGFADLRLLAPTLADAGLNLDARGPIYLDGHVVGTLAELSLDDVSARLGDQTRLALSGTLSNPLDPSALAYDVQLTELTSSYADLQRYTQGLGLPPELRSFGRFRASGALTGTTTELRGKDLRLSTSGRTGFRGDVALRNLDNPTNLYIDANVRSLTTDVAELRGFIPDSLGVNVEALGDVDFSGRFKGTLTDFALQGQLDTDIGSSTQDIIAKFNPDYTDGAYTGNLALDSFDVGRLLGDTTIGTLSLNLQLNGTGISPEEISTKLNTTIESFTYLGYTYHDVYVNGDIDQQAFRGYAEVDDPNVKFRFNGLVDFSDSLPDLQFALRVDTMALQPLGFYPSPLGMSASIHSNLQGNSADNIVGSLRVDSLYLQDSTTFAMLDSLKLRAGDTTQGRFLLLNSPILTASVIGKYYTADLAPLLTNYVNDFFPVDDYLNPKDAPTELAIEPTTQRVSTDQQFTYDIQLRDPVAFVNLFDPALRALDTASLVGTFDSREKVLTGEFFLPNLNYDGYTVDTILVDLGGDARTMAIDLRTRTINAAGQRIDLVLANLRLGNDSLHLELNGYLERDSLLLATGLRVSEGEAGRYVINLDPELQVAGQHWAIDPANRIEYFNNYLDIQDLVFRKDNQSIAIQSDDDSEDADIAPLSVVIKNYNLNEIARLVQLEGFSLDGLVNGKLAVKDPAGTMYYTADVDVNDIVLNEQPVGDLILNAGTAGGNADNVNIDLRLNGPVNDVNVGGTYGIADGALDMDVNIGAIELRLADPLATGIISNSTGVFKADMTVTGTVEQPVVNGFAGFDDAATTYDLLGIRLGIADSRIDFTQTRMDFGTFVVTDSAGRKATLTGKIDHDYFSDFRFDLNLQTDEFRVLNTEPAYDALYYGQAVVKANVDITGDLELPIVRVDAETKPNTEVYIQPLISTNGVSEEDWVIYADPYALPKDSTLTLQDVYQANSLGLDLAMELHLKDDAILHVIVDPLTGDALRAQGDSEMSVQMSPDGDINVTGIYTITEGEYQFTLQGGGFAVKQIDFNIRPGSRLQFIGDPLDTRFDITAVYTTQTSTYALIQAEVADENSPEARAAKQRQDVNVLMNMKGDLEEPALSLSIEVPNAGGNSTTSAVARKLALLEQDQNALYKQVFGLLVLNSFISEQSSGGGFNAAGAATNMAISSLSNLVSNQLNSLADNLVKGVDINVGVESYENDYGGGRTTKGNIDVSKSLLDDRLVLTFGSQLDASGSSGANSSGAKTGGLQTSFVLSYLLNKAGNYQLRVFRQPNVDVLSATNSYETGAGVSFQKKFD